MAINLVDHFTWHFLILFSLFQRWRYRFKACDFFTFAVSLGRVRNRFRTRRVPANVGTTSLDSNSFRLIR